MDSEGVERFTATDHLKDAGLLGMHLTIHRPIPSLVNPLELSPYTYRKPENPRTPIFPTLRASSFMV